mgnify:CR=1 FL=1
MNITKEQKRDMAIKGYNPLNEEDVYKYLNGVPKQYNYQEEDLGASNQKTELMDDSGEILGTINENAYAEISRIPQKNNIKQPIIKQPSMKQNILKDDPFSSVLNNKGNVGNETTGYNDGVEYLLFFIEAMKTGKRKNALIKLNEVVKKRQQAGESYEKGLRKAELQLLKKFNG